MPVVFSGVVLLTLEEGQEVNPNDYDTFNVKGRWCLQGHLNPDLEAKAEQGLLKSPTLSQLRRMCLMQVIASQDGSSNKVT